MKEPTRRNIGTIRPRWAAFHDKALNGLEGEEE